MSVNEAEYKCLDARMSLRKTRVSHGLDGCNQRLASSLSVVPASLFVVLPIGKLPFSAAKTCRRGRLR